MITMTDEKKKEITRLDSFGYSPELLPLSLVAMRYPFNSVQFPKRDYPRNLTQREKISEKKLSEHFIFSKPKERRSRKKMQKMICLMLSQ